MDLGDFGFLEKIIKKEEYKWLFKLAAEKRKEGLLIPEKGLFSLFTRVKQADFKGVYYVPFISDGLSLYLKEHRGKSFEDMEKEGYVIIPQALTCELHEGKRCYHLHWKPLMEEIVTLIINNEVEVKTFGDTEFTNVNGIKVEDYNSAYMHIDCTPRVKSNGNLQISETPY